MPASLALVSKAEMMPTISMGEALKAPVLKYSQSYPEHGLLL